MDKANEIGFEIKQSYTKDIIVKKNTSANKLNLSIKDKVKQFLKKVKK